MPRKIFERVIATPSMSLAMAIIFLLPREPEPFRYQTCDGGDDFVLWEKDEGARCDGCADMFISTVSFPPGSGFEARVLEATGSWIEVERCKALISYLPFSGGYRTGNGFSEVVFDNIDNSGGTLAVTRSVYNGLPRLRPCLPFDDANISEADVIFDVAEPWYTSSFDYQSSNRHLGLVAVHEFGHVLGLSPRNDLHENRVLATMNSQYPVGGPVGHARSTIPLADDRKGIRFLYSEGGTAKADLAASNYKRTGGNGTSGLVSGPISAFPGEDVTFEFTFMNLGSANSGSFNMGFYLSDNNVIIGESDLFLGENLGAFCNVGVVFTFSRTLNIPSDVAPGNYFVGMILDKDVNVEEWSENNNNLAQPQPIEIKTTTITPAPLTKNFPNPFNPSTVIQFEVEQASHVTLKIYNSLGQETATLMDGKLPAGKHSASFDAAALPSGVYFYRLSVNGVYKERNRMLLLK